ncbi:uncharacterized protein LOC128551231 [Mercenaria mercenaria]|uniref:uncharacterized protein LOC128551231 n=1 Tax=Mercenaria mercenaria TaxID=6596 RepID=UPI00234EC783|nr:uncharacterized protein LOC128551231 [Mercenaria mercenaria]XP_053387894.1 uncharacterized protein LOC128551231 [Mercenaria mercenaria]
MNRIVLELLFNFVLIGLVLRYSLTHFLAYREGSIIANYSVRYGTADKLIATQLVEAIVELEKGTELTFDGQSVNASSDTYKGMELCEVLYSTVGSCGEGYICNVENGIPVCSLQEEQSEVNVKLIIGLSAAGVLSLIGAALLFVLIRRNRRRLKKKQETNFPNPINKRDVDEASDFYRRYKWQDGMAVDAGTRLPTTRYMFPRFTTNRDGFDHPYIMPARR